MLTITRKCLMHVYFSGKDINDHCNIKCCFVHDRYYNLKLCTSDVLQDHRERERERVCVCAFILISDNVTTNMKHEVL